MPAYGVRNSLLWHSTIASYASLTEANAYRCFMMSACLPALSASREVLTSAAEGFSVSRRPRKRALLPIALKISVLLQDTWPGIDQTGNGGTGTAQNVHQGVGQTATPSPGKPVSLPGTGTEKTTDAS